MTARGTFMLSNGEQIIQPMDRPTFDQHVADLDTAPTLTITVVDDPTDCIVVRSDHVCAAFWDDGT